MQMESNLQINALKNFYNFGGALILGFAAFFFLRPLYYFVTAAINLMKLYGKWSLGSPYFFFSLKEENDQKNWQDGKGQAHL